MGLKSKIQWDQLKSIAKDDQCPQGGEHEFEPDWKWDRRIDDFDFVDQICRKCGEVK
jgi:hypothetical protein